MDINYWETGLFIIVILLLLIWLIRRNRKDEQTFEKDVIRSELKPEAEKDHDEPTPDNV